MTETLDCNTIVDIRSGIAEGIRATGTSTLRPLVVTTSTSILQLLASSINILEPLEPTYTSILQPLAALAQSNQGHLHLFNAIRDAVKMSLTRSALKELENVGQGS